MTEHCDLNHAPIGVFDSGVGGLTVAREIMRQIPDERIVYFGDYAKEYLEKYIYEVRDNLLKNKKSEILKYLEKRK